MSNTQVGNVYQQIIQDVVESSRVDFEEGGVEDQVLEELKRVSHPLPFFPSLSSSHQRRHRQKPFVTLLICSNIVRALFSHHGWRFGVEWWCLGRGFVDFDGTAAWAGCPQFFSGGRAGVFGVLALYQPSEGNLRQDASAFSGYITHVDAERRESWCIRF